MKSLRFPGSRRKFVYHTIRRYKETGGAVHRARSGRPRTVRTPQLKKVVWERIRRNFRQSMRKMALDLKFPMLQSAKEISEAHGTFRNKKDVSKKWSNVLAKYKPIICDKISSARKTEGGSPTAELTELKAKLKSIKEKELFDGIQGGIYISNPLGHYQSPH